MPDTNYDKFNLVVSTLFLNKWYLKKSTFFENDPYNCTRADLCSILLKAKYEGKIVI